VAEADIHELHSELKRLRSDSINNFPIDSTSLALMESFNSAVSFSFGCQNSISDRSVHRLPQLTHEKI